MIAAPNVNCSGTASCTTKWKRRGKPREFGILSKVGIELGTLLSSSRVYVFTFWTKHFFLVMKMTLGICSFSFLVAAVEKILAVRLGSRTR